MKHDVRELFKGWWSRVSELMRTNDLLMAEINAQLDLLCEQASWSPQRRMEMLTGPAQGRVLYLLPEPIQEFIKMTRRDGIPPRIRDAEMFIDDRSHVWMLTKNPEELVPINPLK